MNCGRDFLHFVIAFVLFLYETGKPESNEKSNHADDWNYPDHKTTPFNLFLVSFFRHT